MKKWKAQGEKKTVRKNIVKIVYFVIPGGGNSDCRRWKIGEKIVPENSPVAPLFFHLADPYRHHDAPELFSPSKRC